MEYRFIEHNHSKIAEVIATGVAIATSQDALDLLATARYEGADNVIVYEHQLDPAFFNLKTKIAGDILQKFSNYGSRLAIVGSFDRYKSSALNDFIRECNRGRQIFFVTDRLEALTRLSHSNKVF